MMEDNIRLNKIAKELDLGVSTIVEFLNKRGANLSNDPNQRIESKQYDLLVKEFRSNILAKKQAEIERERKKVISAEIKASVQKKEVKVLGRIDLDENRIRTKNSENQSNRDRNKDSKSVIPKCIGKIDLSSINTKTRPDKKGNNKSNNDGQWDKHNDIFNDDSTELLKDVWLKHIDVQEQILNLRSMPIDIDPESVKFSGKTMSVRVNEIDRLDNCLNEIANAYKISPSDVDKTKGYFFVDEMISNNVNEGVKKNLINIAQRSFVDFEPEPMLDGTIFPRGNVMSILDKMLNDNNIDYAFDKKGRLQISVDDLKSVCYSCEENLDIAQIANVVLPISPNPVFFLTKMYPGISWKHLTRLWYYRGSEERPIVAEKCIEVLYHALDQKFEHYLYNEIGLSLSFYQFSFYVDKVVVDNYKKKHKVIGIDGFDSHSNSFVFKFTPNINNDKLRNYNDVYDYNYNYTLIRRCLDKLFGFDNIREEIKFVYKYDNDIFFNHFIPKQNTNWVDDFWQTNYSLFKGKAFTVSQTTGTIGFDFCWKDEEVLDWLKRICEINPFISFSYYKNHKCNFDIKSTDASLTEVSEDLKSKFPSIRVDIDDRNGVLYFYQKYKNHEQRAKLTSALATQFSNYERNGLVCKICDIPLGKDKYVFKPNKMALSEHISETVANLRGAEFCMGKESIGKLLRVNYPTLVFDVSLADVDEIKQLCSLNSHIKPNLTGDIEKIARLKNAFNAISTSSGIYNPNLGDFIFDSSKARGIDGIDEKLDNSSEIYKDVNSNLLNTRVNESQKQAIIKTLLTEDLALVQGPPGTGKSTAIAEIIWQHIRRNPQERILLTSETNLAVDNAIDRIVNKNHNLVKPIRFGDEEKLEAEGLQFNLDAMRRWVNGESIICDDIDDDDNDDIVSSKMVLQNWVENIERRIDSKKLGERLTKLWRGVLMSDCKDFRQIIYDNYVNNCNVVGATCSSIGEKNTKKIPTQFYKNYCELFGKITKKSFYNRKTDEECNFTNYEGKITFDTIIQDEASKATPAELSLPLIYGKKNIIIGDHRQLPPMLDREEFLSSLSFLLDRTNDKNEQRKIKNLLKFVSTKFHIMEKSHFERLFERIDPSLRGVFNVQYRMHPDINEVIKQFYVDDGGLSCGLNPKFVDDPDVKNPQSRYHGIDIEGLVSPNNHVVWIDTRSPEMLDVMSRVNYGEVNVIREVLAKFRESDSFRDYQNLWDNEEDRQIGLISFYGKQIKQLNNLRKEFRDIPIRVSTVDRFQGMERNIIIVSMVRSNCIASSPDQKPDYEQYGVLGYPEQTDLGFAQSPNRLNVALSRAKRLLIIVGNSDLFRQKPIYNNVYECIENNPNGRIIKVDAK